MTTAAKVYSERVACAEPAREIVLITFLRRKPDGTAERCPENIPRAEVTSWGQVLEWWGGGAYRAIGLNAQREPEAIFPGPDHWVHVPGEARPFVRRSELCAEGRMADA